MKTNSHVIMILLLCLVSLAACKKNDPLQNGGGTTPTDTTHTGANPPPGGGNTGGTNPLPGNSGSIYVCGWEYGLPIGNSVAMYWKDGAVTLLTDGKNTAQATGIALIGQDVYVCGYELVNDDIAVAKVWKNGVAMALSDGTYDTRPTGITVSGNDVYVCGSEYDPSTKIRTGKYWKNGVVHTIPFETGTDLCYLSGITISGNDVYMSGFVENTAAEHVTPKYFINDDQNYNVASFRNLPGATTDGIAVLDHKVYLCGAEASMVAGGFLHADLWTDGFLQQLTGDKVNGEGIAIVLNGGNTYTAGYAADASGTFALYWKNDETHYFSNGVRPAIALGIAVVGNDVYGVGEETIDAARGYGTPRLWKNNTVMTLADGSGGGSSIGRATGIAIAK